MPSEAYNSVYQQCIEAGWKKDEHKIAIKNFLKIGEKTKHNLDLISTNQQNVEFEKLLDYVKTNIYIIGCEIKWRKYNGDQKTIKFVDWLYHVSSPAVLELYLEMQKK